MNVFFPPHVCDLAYDFQEQRLEDALFLRAQREADGRRTVNISTDRRRGMV